MKKIREFLENGKWRLLKKNDWLVLALIGVLMMVIALPSGKSSSHGGLMKSPVEQTKGGQQETEGMVKSQTTEQDTESYTACMEEKLEKILSKIEGVGKVEVMITCADKGEYIVEKDRPDMTTATTEEDGTGGSRTVTEHTQEETTVYVETGSETYPYVQKEKLPEIVGIIVVAEGGGNSVVVSDISDAVKALFPVEAHRIKVVKMCSKEE